MAPIRTRVTLACSGLEHAHRGFESFARECFDALKGEPALDIELVKGSGDTAPGERALRALRRDRPTALALGRVLHARPYRIEALAFALALQAHLARRRPDVVYLSEWDTARGLAALRRLTRAPFRLLLCNGGFVAEGFGRLDCVQELTPAAREYVLARGADPGQHVALPLGFDIAPALEHVGAEDRRALRRRHSLPAEGPIVISVAALNRSHKRLHYLIEEVAALPAPRPFVLMVGEPDAETPALRALAAQRLGADGHAFRRVRAPVVPDLLKAADVFVLASLEEAQGRALIEAAIHGLPALAHDSPVMRYALGPHGRYGDFGRPGTLTGLLSSPRAWDAEAAHRFVFERFSWTRLRPHYVALFQTLAAGGAANSTVSSSTGENVSR